MSYTFSGSGDPTHYKKRENKPTPAYDLENVKQAITSVQPEAFNYGAYNTRVLEVICIPNTKTTEEVAQIIHLTMIRHSSATTKTTHLRLKLSQRSMESLYVTIMSCAE